MRRLDLDFADHIIAEDLAVLRDDARRDARQWRTNGAGSSLALIWIAHDHQRLAHSIALENRVAVARVKRGVHVRGKRRGSRDEEARVRADVPRLLVRYD